MTVAAAVAAKFSWLRTARARSNPPMRTYRDESEQAPVKRQPERRKDFFTRAIVSGLQEMTAEIETLPVSEARTAALVAVSRYAQSIAAAIDRRKQDEADWAKTKSTAFAGATLVRDSGNATQS